VTIKAHPRVLPRGHPRDSHWAVREQRIRWVARIWAEVAIVLWLLTQAARPSPVRGEGDYWELVASLATIAVIAIGHVISWRWEIQGATVMAVGGALLALLTAFRAQMQEAVAIEGRGGLDAQLVLVAFAVPAFLYWFIWRRGRPRRRVIGLALLYAILVAGTWAVSIFAFSIAYGNFHPTSAVAAPPPSAVVWHWTGPPTATRTAVAARVADPAADVRLAVSDDPSLADPVFHDSLQRPSDDPGAVRFEVAGLAPDTRYYYALEVDGTLATERTGSLRTVPEGPADLLLAFGACIQTNSSGQVFDRIREAAPDLFVVTGDFAYQDFWTDSRSAVRMMYDTQLTSPAISALLADVPAAYVWDDHDFGPNDADSTAASRPAGQTVYRQTVPYLDLPAGPGTQPIYQSFTLGGVRVILTDGRSERVPKSAPDDENKSMLGERQLRWLEAELLRAAADGQFVVLVTNVPWNGPATEGADDWAGYTTERQRIADMIASTGVADQLLMVAGDAHMVAIDDGTHTDFSTDQTGGFPLLHAAALDRPGSVKGGSYTEGYHEGPGQFGLVRISDAGGAVTVGLEGRNYEDEVLVDYTFEVPAAALGR
jgi:phosphodiesterase/alkaline phosphatase D-like protein